MDFNNIFKTGLITAYRSCTNMGDLYTGRKGRKLLLLTSFIFFTATLNNPVAAEDMPMPCPGENAPPLDIVFFTSGRNIDIDLEFLIKNIGTEFYWSPDDATKGVSVTIQIFIGGDNDYVYPIVGVRSLDELLNLDISNPRQSVLSASESFSQLEAYALANPEPAIFRNNSDKVLVYLVTKSDYPDSEAWVNTMVGLHSRFRVITIGLAYGLNESQLREASSPPRQANHSYWLFLSPDSEAMRYIEFDFKDVLFASRNIAWAICSREIVPAPERLPPPMPCQGHSQVPLNVVIFLTLNDFVTPVDFEHLKAFLISIGYYFSMNHYNKGEGVQISVIIIPGRESDISHPNLYLGDHHAFYSLELAINEMIKFNGTEPNIFLSIYVALMEGYLRNHRSVANSFAFEKAIIISNIEDPFEGQMVIETIHFLNLYCTITMIGIGPHINETQIRWYAHRPKLENHSYFILDSYEQLQPLARNISWAVCTSDWQSPPPVPPEPERDPIPMPCPGRLQPPLDIVFFIPTGMMSSTEYDLLKTFLLSITDYVYLTPQDPSTGVSLSVVNFGLQSEVHLPVEGVVTKEDLELSMDSITRFYGNEVFAENTTQKLLLRFVDNRPEQRILRADADHVFIFIMNKLFNDSQAWRAKIEQSLAGANEYDYMNIAIGNELDGSEDIRESASLPRLRNHNYWHLSSFEELVERASNITWSICTRRMNPVPSILPEVTTVDTTSTVDTTTTVEVATVIEESTVIVENEEAVDCGEPPWPSRGSVTFTSTIFQSSALYTCDSGYTSNQTLIRICGITGKWQGETIKCLPEGGANTSSEMTTLSQPETNSTNMTSSQSLSSAGENTMQEKIKIALVTVLPIAGLGTAVFGSVMLLCKRKRGDDDE